MLAASYREKLPDVDVDTMHAAFRVHESLADTHDLMSGFDLVVVEEVGQLSQEDFERLLALWDFADRRPGFMGAVVPAGASLFMGDLNAPD